MADSRQKTKSSAANGELADTPDTTSDASDSAAEGAGVRLNLTVAERGGWTVVRLQEPSLMDVKAIERLHLRVNDLVREGKLKLVLDFKKVQYISSSMVGVLVAIRQDVSKAGGELILCSLNERLQELLKLTRLLPMFRIEPDAPTALKGVGAAK